MSDVCETVKVKTEDGYKVINKSDMTKDDVVYKEPEAEKPKAMNKKELQEALDEAGIAYETDANKPALQKLLDDSKSDPA